MCLFIVGSLVSCRDDVSPRSEADTGGKAVPAETAHGKLPVDKINTLPREDVEKALPNEHPSAYYIYAGRLFNEGKKDDAVFWLYVGKLRYKLHLKANPKLEPSGDPALFSSLNATVGLKINEYAGGNVKDWVKAINRALKWDADKENGFTSKKQYKAIFEDNREGLKKFGISLPSQADTIRKQREKAGLKNRG